MLKLSVLFSAIMLCLSSSGTDMYVWQRRHSASLDNAVEEFRKNHDGELLFLAGELENSGNAVYISPGAKNNFINTTAVIRIHVKNMQRSPADLAAKIIDLYTPWEKCSSLQIDLDCPEYKLEYYTSLMRELRRLLPRECRLSATVLPCHLRHKQKFQALADECDFFVIQVHGLSRKNGHPLILDRDIAADAIDRSGTFARPFKVALPLYCHHIANGIAKPDFQIFPELIRRAKKSPFMHGVIGFRLGVPGDKDALLPQNAIPLCEGKKYSPEIIIHWQKHSSGAWYLYLENRGFFSEKVTLICQWRKDFSITDFDTFNRAEATGKIAALSLTLPPDGERRSYLWLRTENNFDLDKNNPLNITIKGSSK